MNNIITSSGIIKDRDKPRVGVISANSEKLVEWIYDDLDQGIDLDYETYILELEEQGLSEEEIERECEFYEHDSRNVIFGDAWIKGQDGKYSIDKTKTFAASFNSDTNNICIEWSKYTRQCHNTSPCYVMADGRGPCGDLDTDGDSVIAYDLPPEFYNE